MVLTKMMPSSVLRSRATTELIGEPADAGQREHAFHHHAAAEQRAELQPKHRHHRQQRIARDVAPCDAALGEPLGARGAHEVEAVDLEHAGAHQPQIDREIDERHRDRRHDQMARDIEHASRTGEVRAERAEAAERQPGELDREDHDHHQPEPEARHRIGDERKRHQRGVGPAPRTARRRDTEGQAEAEGKADAGGHQQQRRRQALEDQQADRLVVDVGVAEIEREHAPEKQRELLPHRPVEPPAGAQFGDLRRIGAAAEAGHIGVDRIAGREPQQQEVADEDNQDDRQRLEETASDQAASQVEPQPVTAQRGLSW